MVDRPSTRNRADERTDKSDMTSNNGKAGNTGGKDNTTRLAAIWATLLALPVAVLAGFIAFAQLTPEQPEAQPSPSATTPRAQSSEPVTMPAPQLAEWPARVCRALLAELPTELDDLAQRPVTAGAEQNAAYGDPAITLACGVPAPTIPPTDRVWGVNGACWHLVEEGEAAIFTTVDREVPVQVTVPNAYKPPMQWLAPLSTAVATSVKAAESAPSGCTG